MILCNYVLIDIGSVCYLQHMMATLPQFQRSYITTAAMSQLFKVLPVVSSVSIFSLDLGCLKINGPKPTMAPTGVHWERDHKLEKGIYII